MMELTRKGEYAIRGMVYLASKPDDKLVLISDIAASVDVPQTFLAKIFQQFSKIGIVNSYRGTGGGFSLGRSPKDITLLEIVEAVEGPIVLNRCVSKQQSCARTSFCKVHPVWQNIQSQVRDILAKTTLNDLI